MTPNDTEKGRAGGSIEASTVQYVFKDAYDKVVAERDALKEYILRHEATACDKFLIAERDAARAAHDDAVEEHDECCAKVESLQSEVGARTEFISQQSALLDLAVSALEFVAMPMTAKNPTVESLLTTMANDSLRAKDALTKIAARKV